MMIRNLFLIMFFLIISCESTTLRKEKNILNEDLTNRRIKDSLAFELCEIYGLDQGIRQQGILEHIIKTEAAKAIELYNFNRVIEFIKENGYPTEELVGMENFKTECVSSAVWAVLLHNPVRVRENYIDLLLDEVSKGNMTYENIANILDKEIWSKSRGQNVLYGSDFGMPCAEQKAETQKARRRIGLPPLKDSLFRNCDKK